MLDASPRAAVAEWPVPGAGDLDLRSRRGAGVGDSRLLAWLVLVAFATTFLVQALPRIDAEFGDSHDGENGAVWGLASRELRSSGLVGSRAGASLGNHEGVYAHHPPLIIWETASVETLLGEHRWATRAPAWLGSLASIALLYLLLVTLGLRRLPSALAVALALSGPMFLLYGTMLDTLQIALPLTLGYLLVRTSAQRGTVVAPWAQFGVTMLVVLGSWEGWLLCGVFAVFDIARDRREMHRWRVSAMTSGAIVGGIITAAWLWWGNGSWSEMLHQAVLRSGSGGRRSWSDFVGLQWAFLGTNLGVLTLAVAALGLPWALWRRWNPGFLCVVTGTTLAYPVLLRDGAMHHDYWNYWLLVPACIGVGFTFDRSIRWISRRYDSPLLGYAIAAVCCIALVVTTLASTDPPAERFASGLQARRLAQQIAASRPDGPWAAAGNFGASDVRWANYSFADRGRFSYLTPPEVSRHADRDPAQPVLVKCLPLDPAYRTMCSSHGSPVYFVATLGEVASALDPAATSRR